MDNKTWDPDKLIIGWVGAKNVPSWVERGSYRDCKSCDVRLKRSATHHCRLCGSMYCSMCTGKYHVPKEFRKKGKEGPVRVCWGCRDKALSRRQEKLGAVTLRPHQVTSHVNGVMHIHPPTWVGLEAYKSCWMCHLGLPEHPFHCRLCGEMFCKECTIKETIPQAFHKKGKTGPVRVCTECRWYVKHNVVLDEDEPRPQPQAKARLEEEEHEKEPSSGSAKAPPMASTQAGAGTTGTGVTGAAAAAGRRERPDRGAARAARARRRQGEDVDTDGDAGPDAGTDGAARRARRERGDRSARRGGASVAASGAAATGAAAGQANQTVTLNVKRMNSTKVLTTIEVPASSSLVEINARVLDKIPKLRDREFHYFCRDRPVFPEFWDLFRVDCFADGVVVGQGKAAHAIASRAGYRTRDRMSPRELELFQKWKREHDVKEAEVAALRAQQEAELLLHEERERLQREAKARLAAQEAQAHAAAAQAERLRLEAQQKMDFARQQKEEYSRQQYASSGAGSPSSHGAATAATTAASGPPAPPTAMGTRGGPVPPPASAAAPTSMATHRALVGYPPGTWVVRAKFTYDAQTDTNISFVQGDEFPCIKHDESSQWWFGEIGGTKGWFPAAYTERVAG